MSFSENVERFSVVNTKYGPVRGNERISFLGNRFFSYRSIPYARPPVGVYRFRDPQPPAAWTEPLDATKPCNHAPFFDLKKEEVCIISEDCLVLNVYTRSLLVKNPLPVMVWFHGGAFRDGSSSEYNYGPDFLMRRHVVLVSINYRLGALGFLSISDRSLKIPGNAGLKDQTLALRWVRDNIEEFGGDPNNVTVFGTSAGACSIHLHMLSEHSKDLFHKAIIQSGTGLSDWANFPKYNWSKRLARAIGWKGGTDRSMLTFLQRADVDQIIAHQDSIISTEEQKLGIFPFGPAVESYVGTQSFFTKDPKLLAQNPWSVSVPMIIGANADEMLMMTRSFKRELDFLKSLNGFEMIVPADFGHKRGGVESMKIAKEIKNHYYGEKDVAPDNYHPAMQAWADRFFWYPLKITVEARLQNPNATAPTYVYRFDVDSRVFNWKKLKFIDEYAHGAAHGEEVHYLFKCAKLQKHLPSNSVEMTTVNRMVTMWTNFAATGNPNSLANDSQFWKPVTDLTQPIRCLRIAQKLTLGELPETKNLDFWTRIYKENQKAQKKKLWRY